MLAPFVDSFVDSRRRERRGDSVSALLLRRSRSRRSAIMMAVNFMLSCVRERGMRAMVVSDDVEAVIVAWSVDSESLGTGAKDSGAERGGWAK